MEIQTVQPFLRYFDNVRERTMHVARCIPEDKVDWAYANGKFTLGALLRHLAIAERYMWAENALGRPACVGSHGQQLPHDLSGILQWMERLHAESMGIFGQLTDDQLRAKCTTPAGNQLALSKWLRSMTEHEIHHRGQLYVYLGILGVATPPIFGLTFEEVLARSGAPN
jgi:uncharacterized damage-inducible protein DinB